MDGLFHFPSARRNDRAVAEWFAAPEPETRRLARPWFQALRDCGPDIRELMHDGHPVACVEDVAFAYVGAFQAHVNIGFYEGASLPDPAALLEGSGKRMRHVKVRWGQPVDAPAIRDLIAAAYRDMQARIAGNGTPL